MVMNFSLTTNENIKNLHSSLKFYELLNVYVRYTEYVYIIYADVIHVDIKWEFYDVI